MANKDPFQKYLDAGIAFANLTRSKAEELVAELVKNGEFQGKDAKAKVDELIERSRKSREALVGQVRQEVTRQLESVGITSVEDLAAQVAVVLNRTVEAGKSATSKKAPAKKSTTKTTPTKKTPAKKTAAKKTAAKKAPAKKAAAKKTPAKKTAAKKAPAKKAAAANGAAPVAGTGGPGTGSAD